MIALSTRTKFVFNVVTLHSIDTAYICTYTIFLTFSTSFFLESFVWNHVDQMFRNKKKQDPPLNFDWLFVIMCLKSDSND